MITEYDSTIEDTSIQNVQHHVELTAPALNAARYRILTVYHKRELVYPASVEAECFEPSDYDDYESFSWPEALREEDFLKIMKTTLRSKKVTSLIHSLIARSNEQRYLAGRPSADGSTRKPSPSNLRRSRATKGAATARRGQLHFPQPALPIAAARMTL